MPWPRSLTSGLRPQQAADRLHLAQDWIGDRTCPLGTAVQHAIDIGAIRRQSSHLPADAAELRHRKLRQRILEDGEILAGKTAQCRLARETRECRIDADQI